MYVAIFYRFIGRDPEGEEEVTQESAIEFIGRDDEYLSELPILQLLRSDPARYRRRFIFTPEQTDFMFRFNSLEDAQLFVEKCGFERKTWFPQEAIYDGIRSVSSQATA